MGAEVASVMGTGNGGPQAQQPAACGSGRYKGVFHQWLLANTLVRGAEGRQKEKCLIKLLVLNNNNNNNNANFQTEHIKMNG